MGKRKESNAVDDDATASYKYRRDVIKYIAVMLNGNPFYIQRKISIHPNNTILKGIDKDILLLMKRARAPHSFLSFFPDACCLYRIYTAYTHNIPA